MGDSLQNSVWHLWVLHIVMKGKDERYKLQCGGDFTEKSATGNEVCRANTCSGKPSMKCHPRAALFPDSLPDFHHQQLFVM